MASVTLDEIERWLREDRDDVLADLWERADQVRRETVGDEVHLRGLVEFSNYCLRNCTYCGIRRGNRRLQRYRMEAEEILACAQLAQRLGYGTVVLQSGQDEDFPAEWLADVIYEIKKSTGLAVTLSVGERDVEELRLWKEAGADRYFLRFETSDPHLYRRIHPPLPGRSPDRIAQLRIMRELGYEIGSGVMIGIPGQSFRSLARDILLFAELDLDMIGVGPYIAHPDTPLGRSPRPLRDGEQVPATDRMTYKVIALARLVCPEANIPATTALATVNAREGRALGLARGANVVMPNITPLRYRTLYDIYPGKGEGAENPEAAHLRLLQLLESLGRKPGSGPGSRMKRACGAGVLMGT
ncbi:MAG: [FeFe] hydrogenase H-cluster radical SAM maturase HydE [candidate division KSB1 bacterium]|nr:[FeFe] hydrogenase H-cluster radical SAM maturase HydE [candidate division KSB1 bacterium]